LDEEELFSNDRLRVTGAIGFEHQANRRILFHINTEKVRFFRQDVSLKSGTGASKTILQYVLKHRPDAKAISSQG